MKNRGKPRVNPVSRKRTEASVIKSEIENALIASLDPVSAARALKALQGSLAMVNDLDNDEDRSQSADNLDKLKRPQPRVVANMQSGTTYKLSLPPIFIDAQQERFMSGSVSEREIDSMTPNSTRSTASEPAALSAHRSGREMGVGDMSTRDRKIFHRQHKNGQKLLLSDSESQHPQIHPQMNPKHLPSLRLEREEEIARDNSNHISRSQPSSGMNMSIPKPVAFQPQPPYNAPAALNALRLARSSMQAKQKSGPDYSAFWGGGWNGNKGAGTGAGTGAGDDSNSISLDEGNGDKQQSAQESAISRKVERVKRMQQMYVSQKQAGASAITDEEDGTDGEIVHSFKSPSTKRRIQPSPMRKPKTPQVGDMTLDDDQLNLIAKYFEQDGARAVAAMTNTEVKGGMMGAVTPIADTQQRQDMNLSQSPDQGNNLVNQANHGHRQFNSMAPPKEGGNSYANASTPGSLDVRIPSMPITSDAMNEMFGGGGADSLLNWTAGLDASEYD